MGEHGGICLGDLHLSARGSRRAQACEARGQFPGLRVMAQESQLQGSPIWAGSSKAYRVLPSLCHISYFLGRAEGENRAGLQRRTRNEMPPSPVP